MLKKLRISNVLMAMVIASILSGCAATHTMVSKRNLEVQARTSTPIFVDAVAREKRTIYMDVRSGVMEFDRREFKRHLREQFALNDNGYALVDDPEKAQYQMAIYVLNLEKASPSAAEAALGKGFVGGVAAGAAGGAILGGRHARGGGALVGGLIGGITSTIADAYVKDVTYMLVVDVQIKEKAGKGVIVRKDTKIDTKVSDAGASTQTVSEATTRKEYRTRIVTTANKANLELPEAQNEMFLKTAYAMSGFF